ncbi:MAG: phosphoribosylaminoimidazolesuccinocarboxamide synthase [Candidatus Poribacteria bacterium]|nr:phosphoribosylaminoimidazolesuccinocarboxamide synthase [Candidatus Poribacteria bacterium]MDE0504030.1 phosphoribosylaminoimidazolesuccinocarboxamide synthase [Candidatus Poribacteria bacterium]
MTQSVVTETNLTNVPRFSKGKVRDLYDLDDKLLMISTDRISAFDYVLPDGIPCKGNVLTALSEFWFNHTNSIVDNHLITTDVDAYPDLLKAHSDVIAGRSMLVRKADRIDIECVVRGYITGSAWSEYQTDGTVCGEKLPEGLRESDRLPQLIFTPATKAEQGEHDENISIARMEELIGKELSARIIETSFALFESASRHAEKVGIILCDTKFEFGLLDDKLILIDEVFTPDSSRFWPKDEYVPGKSQSSFDKQYVRDYLSEVGWNKNPPAPHLPEDVIQKTSEKYLEAYRLIVGRELS